MPGPLGQDWKLGPLSKRSTSVLPHALVQTSEEISSEFLKIFEKCHTISVQQDVPSNAVLASDTTVECGLCLERFQSKQSLSDHKASMHALRITWKCRLCDAHIPNLSELMQHISVHLGREPDRPCSPDSYFTRLAGDLAQDCQFCGKSFMMFCDLDKHYRKHVGQKYWECKTCRQIFSGLSDLKTHYHKAMHATALSKIGKITKTRYKKSAPMSRLPGVLRRGPKQVEKESPINIIKETPNQVNDFETDMDCSVDDQHKMPTPATNLLSSFLNAKTQSSETAAASNNGGNLLAGLKRHQLMQTKESPYMCDICDMSYTCKDTLRVHRFMHTGERPYNCGLCSKSFSQSYSLKQHIFVHTEQRPYTCQLCNKIFTDSSTLRKHRHVHIAEKPDQNV